MTRPSAVSRTVFGIMLFVLCWPLMSEPAPVPVALGMSEADVRALLGAPTSQMAGGARQVLLYRDWSVVIQDGKVSRVTPRTQKPAPPPAPTANSAPHETKRDIQAIMSVLRNEKGVPRAYAVHDCDGEWASPAVPLLVPLLDDRTPYKIMTMNLGGRREAAATLGGMAAESLARIGGTSRAPCLNALRTASPHGRSCAAYALHRLCQISEQADPEFYEVLIKVYLSPIMDADEPVVSDRRRMIRILADIGTPEALGALHRSVRHRDRYFSGDVMEHLGRLKREESLAVLADVLFSPPNAFSREKAADALCCFSSAEAARAVLPALSNPDEFLRITAARVLGNAKDPRFVPDLVPLLTDPQREVRREAVRAMHTIDDRAIVLPLAGILFKENEERLTDDITSTLLPLVQTNRDPAVVSALVPGLSSPNALHRKHAVELLGRTGAPKVFADFARLSRNDPDEKIRAQATSYLDNFDDPSRGDILLEVLRHDPSPLVRNHALYRVKYGSLRDRQLPILIDLLQTGNRERQREAILAMDHLHLISRQPIAIAILIQCLSDPDQETSSRAEAILFQQADIPQYSIKGKAIGRDPAKWKGWWEQQGMSFEGFL